jgi:hypothetical protein
VARAGDRAPFPQTSAIRHDLPARFPMLGFDARTVIRVPARGLVGPAS